MSAASDQAGDPFRCVVCGRRDPQCLCRACREAHTDPASGVLAPWVAAERREAQRQSWRVKSAARRGITTESFDRLDTA